MCVAAVVNCAHFRSGNFEVKDEPHFGRSTTEKSDEIIKRIEQDRHISSHSVFQPKTTEVLYW